MFSDTRHLAIACLCVIIVVLLVYEVRGESFATLDDKAKAVHDWFKKNPSGSYAKFRNDLKRESNIVEFEEVSELAKKKPGFTVDDVKRLV